MSDYEQYLLQQHAEQSPRHNDMTLDERMTEYIEWQHTDFDRDIMVDAHLEIIKLRRENNDRQQVYEFALSAGKAAVAELQRVREELADALEEARMNTGLAARQLVENSKLRAEVARLTAELAAAREAWKTFVGMMEPIADDCLCMDEADGDQGENDPSNHSQYCPIYLQAYAEAMANGTEVPE